ncbi:MAG: hypothetical protein ACW98F_14225 [Candidatus Hodarchaeales archaeon]|jgi:hypothetical protein
MSEASFFSQPPFSEFPFNTFLQVIDKLEYLGRNEEQTPYEISPGTDLCISDTYYSLGFLTHLHSYGKVFLDDGKWVLDPKGNPDPEKPYRFALISDAALILDQLFKGIENVQKLDDQLSDLSSDEITNYLRVFVLITQKGQVTQEAKGWDASYILKDW